MKEKLRDALIGSNDLNVREGEYLFYKPGKAFGLISKITESHLIVLWNPRSTSSVELSYSFAKLHLDHFAEDLLDDCMLCETEADRLFVELKYGSK